MSSLIMFQGLVMLLIKNCGFEITSNYNLLAYVCVEDPFLQLWSHISNQPNSNIILMFK